VALFYLTALVFWALAIWTVRGGLLPQLALLPMALHLFWQVAALDPRDGEDALAKFRSNRFAGLLMFLACFVVGTS
jgi:4-hydroxybenzoate polyprenyltransferase